MNFETIIGIEIHCELKTKTKMFSSAPNAFGNQPNTQLSVIDLAFPGTLPRLNKQAVKLAIMACDALNFEIDDELWFDRKNYFYSDLPKGYQITQDKRPIGKNGYIDIEIDGQVKRIGITRLHLEEDTAKQTHYGDYTLLDYNRCGVPLIEIVSEPEIHSALEAIKYVEKLRNILLFTGVSEVKMEEGSMRCDINISLRPYGQKAFGVKTEIKNLNSLNNIEKSIEFEIARQEKILLKGECVEQETRRFDETSRQTVLMRKKNDAADYRYFTEPNIMPIKLESEFIQACRDLVPELPERRFNRYINEYHLSDYIATQLLQQRMVSDYFEECMKHSDDAKNIANWILGDIFSYLNKTNLNIDQFKLLPINLTKLIDLQNKGKISSKQAKMIFDEIKETNLDPNEIVIKLGMEQESDESKILEYVKQLLDENLPNVKLYKSGKENVMAFFIGQIMKKTQGKANPSITARLIKEEINRR